MQHCLLLNLGNIFVILLKDGSFLMLGTRVLIYRHQAHSWRPLTEYVAWSDIFSIRLNNDDHSGFDGEADIEHATVVSSEEFIMNETREWFTRNNMDIKILILERWSTTEQIWIVFRSKEEALLFTMKFGRFFYV